MELGVNHFGWIDYILSIGTLLLSLMIGLYYGYKSKHTNEDLLLGSRSISLLPMAMSVMVSYVSAATILGFPSEIYAHGAQIYVYQLVSAVGITTSALTLVPFFYPMRLTSINEYLEKRFDSVWVRWLASGVFMLQQVVLSGIILYGPTIAMEQFLGIPMHMSILGIGICAIIYTNVGGLKAVVWTDALQLVMMVIGMVFIVWKGITASQGIANAIRLAEEGGRLQLFDFTFDIFARHNFWNILVGAGFHSMMQPGIHQLQVQRYSGMPTCRKAKLSIMGSAPIKLGFFSMCLWTGIALYAFYAKCDPMAQGEIKKIDQIVPYFVVNEMSDVPGMMGIFTSCVFSAVLSSLSSSLNSLAAITWEDFLSRLNYFKSMSPRSQTNVTRLVGVFFGILFICLAFSAQSMGAVFAATISVVGATAGALYGIFLMAMFLPFIEATGALVGAISGLVSISFIGIVTFIYKTTNKVSLPVSTEMCLDGNFTETAYSPALDPTSNLFDEWPWKIASLSYVLYNVAGALITILIGSVISLGIKQWKSKCAKRPHVSLIHPFARNIFGGWIDREPLEDKVCGSEPNGIPMNRKL